MSTESLARSFCYPFSGPHLPVTGDLHRPADLRVMTGRVGHVFSIERNTCGKRRTECRPEFTEFLSKQAECPLQRREGTAYGAVMMRRFLKHL